MTLQPHLPPVWPVRAFATGSGNSLLEVSCDVVCPGRKIERSTARVWVRDPVTRKRRPPQVGERWQVELLVDGIPLGKGVRTRFGAVRWRDHRPAFDEPDQIAAGLKIAAAVEAWLSDQNHQYDRPKPGETAPWGPPEALDFETAPRRPGLFAFYTPREMSECVLVINAHVSQENLAQGSTLRTPSEGEQYEVSVFLQPQSPPQAQSTLLGHGLALNGLVEWLSVTRAIGRRHTVMALGPAIIRGVQAWHAAQAGDSDQESEVDDEWSVRCKAQGLEVTSPDFEACVFNESTNRAPKTLNESWRADLFDHNGHWIAAFDVDGPLVWRPTWCETPEPPSWLDDQLGIYLMSKVRGWLLEQIKGSRLDAVVDALVAAGLFEDGADAELALVDAGASSRDGLLGAWQAVASEEGSR